MEDLGITADASVDTGASDIGGLDNGVGAGDFDSAFSKSFNDAAGAQGEDADADVVEDEQPVIEDEAPEGQDEAEAEPEPLDLEDPNDVQPDLVKDKQYHFREAKAKRLLAAADTMNRIAEVIPGATPEALKGYYEASVKSEEMLADFDSGDPQRVGNFIDYWFSKEAPPAAVNTFASQFLDRLPHAAPEAFRQFQTRSNQALTQGLYEKAVSTNDDQLLLLAQNLDMRQRGSFLEKADFQQQRDPFAAERQRFEQERSAFNKEREAEAQRRLQDRVQGIQRTVDSAKTQAIEEALKPVEKQFRSQPQWKHMLRDLTEHVESALSANQPWQRQFEMARQRAANDPSGKATEQLTAMLKQFIAPVVARNRKAVIEAATGTVMQASAKAHEQGKQTAARREPASPAGPAQRLTHTQKLRETGEKGGFDAAFNVSASRARELAQRRTG